MFMCFFVQFIMCSSFSNLKYYLFYVSDVQVSCPVWFLFIFTYTMYLECHCFIYEGLMQSTLTYKDIACMS